MPWKEPAPRTSLPCLGDYIRKLRNDRGWTQERLAEEAGFTSRLIRKAEAGAPIAADTIEILAETLSTADLHLAPEDLVFSDALVIANFYDSLAVHGARVGYEMRHLFDEKLVIWIAGEETGLPFAGVWRGLDGLHGYFTTLLDCFTFRGTDRGPEMLQTGDDLFVLGASFWSHGPSGKPMSVWQVNRYKLRRGRILEWKNFFDTAAASRLVAERPDAD